MSRKPSPEVERLKKIDDKVCLGEQAGIPCMVRVGCSRYLSLSPAKSAAFVLSENFSSLTGCEKYKMAVGRIQEDEIEALR